MKREGKTDKQASRVPEAALPAQRLAGHERPQRAQHVPLGQGDVLLDYESDAKLAQSQGKPVYYLIPKATLQIETPLAAVNSSNKAAAQKFVNWLYTPPAQTIWAQNGFRPVDVNVSRKFAKQFPPRPWLFKIGYVGGWDRGEHAVLRPDEWDRHEDRAESGGLHWRLTSHGCRGRGAAPSARRP